MKGQKEIVKLLLEKNADITAKDGDGYSALDYAEEKGHTEIVQLLKAEQQRREELRKAKLEERRKAREDRSKSRRSSRRRN